MRSLQRYTLLIFWLMLQLPEEMSTTIDGTNDYEVDKFIHQYVNEVKRTLRLGSDGQHTMKKRSHPDIDLNKLTGLELLIGFREVFSVPTKFPRDLVLFSPCLLDQKQLYAAALEAKPEQKTDSQVVELVLYIHQDGSWVETHRLAAIGGERVALEQIRDSVYLIVAQQQYGSTVWRLNTDSHLLQYVHMLDNYHASHVIMWTDTDMYAAFAISENVRGSQRFSTESPVYRLDGSSFDLIDVLPTFNPRGLAQFNIRSSMFVAVANFQNDLGETAIDSEIFRFDLTSGKFNVYQKLPTEAAVDVKYFCFHSDQVTESFLIFASAFHKDEEGKIDYNTASVVYKLSDEEYFVPFQALHVSKVTSWLPVLHVTDGEESLTLLGASEEGIISFQYNGWRFVPTGLHYDGSTFGPGPKSLNVFYSSNNTLISVANKDSSGYEINTFSPVFKHHVKIENVQNTIAAWAEKMSQELAGGMAKMADLIRVAEEAPSINDSVIELGSHAVFKNAEIDQLETFVTQVGDFNMDSQIYSELDGLKTQLESLQRKLAGLPERIDQTSIHTKTVYDDKMEDKADMVCPQSCRVEDLEVTSINGENLSDFVANAVNTKKPITFEQDMTFNKLALIDPLDTIMINGRLRENLIDWSKDVIMDQNLQVEGDVIVQDSVSVSGAVDGVTVNVVKQEEMVSPRKFLKSLNTSQLLLSDGKLSEVDFGHFNLSTLKTNGDQIFTEFQDIERLEADEVASDLFKSVPVFPVVQQQASCEGENCVEARISDHDDSPIAKASAGYQKIESLNLLDDEIIIPGNVTMYGTLIIENGSLSAKDLIDLNHDISASKLSDSGIPLNDTVIDQHFKFNGQFKTPALNVDTLNSLNLSSLVHEEEAGPVIVTARKVFKGLFTVNGTVNGVDLTPLEAASEDTRIIKFDTVTVQRIDSSNVTLGQYKWQQRVTLSEDGMVVLSALDVEKDMSANSVMVRGKVNNYHLEKLLNDTVFEGDEKLQITGTKHFLGQVKISNLNVNFSNHINSSFVSPENIWKKRFSRAKSIKVDNLYYTGKLDNVDSREFGRWLLTEGDQVVTAAQDIANLQADHVTMLPNGIFNSVNITHLLTESVLLSVDATFDHVVFDMPVVSSDVELGGKMGSLQVPADVVLSDSSMGQLITGHKRVLGGVFINGDLHTSGLISRINLTAFCHAFGFNNSNLSISGNAKFKEEPNISTFINNIDWPDVMRNIWFKEENVTIHEKLMINEAEFEKLLVVNINNNNVDDTLSKLVSLSQDQVINGTFYFSNVRAEKGLEAGEASVGGNVGGIQLSSFLKDVLLNGTQQEIRSYLDFITLTIENGFNYEGLVNGLNLSSDIMLASAASNTLTSELTLQGLSTKELRLPHGASVAGVDLGSWNSTAVTKSGNVIDGNITFSGQFGSGRGIRVRDLVNGLPFDKDHVMLSNVYQKVSGRKTFSAKAGLTIHKLQVDGFFNDINVTDFYNKQVTAIGDVRISGRKKFTSPLWAERVVLPEVYQDHNLTWLEAQLSAPLPWYRYDTQQAMINHTHQLASLSLAGRAYYLDTMARVKDVEGEVLYTFPLKNHNTSVLAAMRRNETRITLSLLHWSEKHNKFLDLPGGVRYFPRVAPSAVQMITLPGGELAAYVTSYIPHNKFSPVAHGDLFRLKDNLITSTMIYGGKPDSTLLSFLDYKLRTCFIVVAERCSVYCHEEGGRTFRRPSFSCNVTKATLFTTDRGTYLMGVQTRPQGLLVLWRLSGKRFTKVLEYLQFNPIGIAATTNTGPHIAVVNTHLVGHSHPETVDIYRFDENTSQLHLEQSLGVVSPQTAVFSSLPTSESVLYMTSFVPAMPLRVYIYRGILGYCLHTEDPTLPQPSDIQPFSDHHKRHFVVVPSNGTACVLRANFKGIN